MVRLVGELIPPEQKESIRQHLVEGGFPDKTVTGAIKAMLSRVCEKALGEVGEQAGKAVGQEIGKVLNY